MSKVDISNAAVTREMMRGPLKLLMLKIIYDKEMHGYGIMKRLEEISLVEWKPSPGSIYPALKSLENDGLIISIPSKGKKVYRITPYGKKFLRHIARKIDSKTENIRNFFSDLVEE